jgi:hypothetical protein
VQCDTNRDDEAVQEGEGESVTVEEARAAYEEVAKTSRLHFEICPLLPDWIESGQKLLGRYQCFPCAYFFTAVDAASIDYDHAVALAVHT